jgi:very-short-patch-repair endonuclease
MYIPDGALPPGILPDHLPNPDGVPRILSRAEAFELGFSRRAIDHRLAKDIWHRVLPHTYLTGSTLTWGDRLQAALTYVGPDSLLTGAAALADLGLRSVRRPDRMLLLAPRTNRARPAGWVHIRRTGRMPRPALIPGPRRADLARAVADLALERRRLDDVRALVAQAVRAQLCTVSELWAEYEAGPRKFSANLRQALEDVDAGAWSAPEARAGELLRNAKVPPFKPNATVWLPDGSYVIADFLWPQLRAVLEIDSVEYHDDPAERDRTDAKHIGLETIGFTVAHRRPALLIREPRRFQREIEAWLAARAVELGRAAA